MSGGHNGLLTLCIVVNKVRRGIWVSNAFYQPYQWFKGYHYYTNVIKGIDSCRGMQHFVNSVSYYLVN